MEIEIKDPATKVILTAIKSGLQREKEMGEKIFELLCAIGQMQEEISRLQALKTTEI